MLNAVNFKIHSVPKTISATNERQVSGIATASMFGLLFIKLNRLNYGSGSQSTPLRGWTMSRWYGSSIRIEIAKCVLE